MLLPNSVEGKSAPFLARVENRLTELERMKGEYMAACKGVREEIKEIYTEAKDADVPTRALKGLVKYRQLAKKQDAIADTIAEDEVSEFEMLVEALGEFGTTELGQAALDLAADDETRFNQDAAPLGEEAAKVVGSVSKRGRKPKADAAATTSPEEAAALADIERDGIAAAGATAH